MDKKKKKTKKPIKLEDDAEADGGAANDGVDQANDEMGQEKGIITSLDLFNFKINNKF